MRPEPFVGNPSEKLVNGVCDEGDHRRVSRSDLDDKRLVLLPKVIDPQREMKTVDTTIRERDGLRRSVVIAPCLQAIQMNWRDGPRFLRRRGPVEPLYR
jgi:hypothetical protein